MVDNLEGRRMEVGPCRALGDSYFSKADYSCASRIYAELAESSHCVPGDLERLMMCHFALGHYDKYIEQFDRYRTSSQPKLRMIAYAYFAACVTNQVHKSDYLTLIRNFSGKLLERHLTLGAGVFHSLAVNGHIEDAYSFKREMAKLFANAEPFLVSPYLTCQIIAALIFLGDFSRAKGIVARVPSNYSWGRAGKVFQELALWCDISGSGKRCLEVEWTRGKLAEAGRSINYRKEFAASEESFRKRVSGKRVAIVGPADTGRQLKEEIDSYDVVVRTNVFSEDDYLLKDNRIGSSVDVSYYTRATVTIRKDDLIRFGNGMDTTFVFRNMASVREFGEENLRAQDRIISYDICTFMPKFKAMHAIQRIAWDLLKYGPRKLKVFNVNFFVGDMYHEKYKPRGTVPTLKSLGIEHDPLQSFKFTKSLQLLGLVEFDEVASEVLKMTEDEYVGYLQNRFGSAWKTGIVKTNLKV